ncbi:Cytochrome PaP450-1 [Diaporthe amygdali]|uniref:Cytochrome PaP450-1 n=1 Tax=Phomopsis amygdali TaxID=1214568 RepID=UPI0022FEFAF9|nr:Cytochrome PaP450-1 [Diaporthe amygdali]KAJ0121357.1 Cytochrome PaP450-1 [Diaporthe amygdali]
MYTVSLPHGPFLGSRAQAAFVSFSVLGLTLLFSKLFYNAYLHPLRKFPGPLLARLSRLYYSYYRSTGRLEWKTLELHKKYGSVVRIAPNELSFNAGTAWDDIYGHTTKRRSGRRLQKEAFFYLGAVAPNGEKNLGASSDEDHSRIRGVLSSAFSEKAVFAQEDLLMRHIGFMIERIRSLNGIPTDAVRWLHHCTFDITTDLSLGASAKTLACDEWSPLAHLMFEGIKEGITAVEILRFAPFKYQAFSLLIKAFGKARLEAFQAAINQAHIRMAQATTDKEDKKPDFMSYIIKANKTSKALTPSEITANVALLLDVGSETTASLLAGCLFYLTKSPHILEKLTSMIRKDFQTPQEINSKHLAQNSYLTAVLNEALRIYPPVAGATPRVTPPEGSQIDGRYVPGNMSVAVNQVAMNRSPKNFTNPDQFVPGRWLGDGCFPDDQLQLCQPFSHGPRACLGRNLAWAEMRLIMGHLLWNFDVELSSESANWNSQKTWFIWDKPDLMIRFKSREGQ